MAGGYGKHTLFDEETIDEFVAPSEMNPTYGLGWRRNGDASMEWMFSPFASDSAYGHTGWTGTVTIIDPEMDLGIVLLTREKALSARQPCSQFQSVFRRPLQNRKLRRCCNCDL